jgi:hypothetical protein
MKYIESKKRLEKVRNEKQPTRVGVHVCGEVMAEMLRLGWRKEDLDDLEILFWSCRDRHGNVL